MPRSEAARSAPSNIAEGFGTGGNKVFANYARIAKGSVIEVLNHIIDARDQDLLTEPEFLDRQREILKAVKTTVGLIEEPRASQPTTNSA